MTELDHILAENKAPAPRVDLSSRILEAARSSSPVNDRPSTRPWLAMGGVAAMAVMAAIFVLQPSVDAEADWNQIADASGFGELYAWVEGEDS